MVDEHEKIGVFDLAGNLIADASELKVFEHAIDDRRIAIDIAKLRVGESVALGDGAHQLGGVVFGIEGDREHGELAAHVGGQGVERALDLLENLRARRRAERVDAGDEHRATAVVVERHGSAALIDKPKVGRREARADAFAGEGQEHFRFRLTVKNETGTDDEGKQSAAGPLRPSGAPSRSEAEVFQCLSPDEADDQCDGQRLGEHDAHRSPFEKAAVRIVVEAPDAELLREPAPARVARRAREDEADKHLVDEQRGKHEGGETRPVEKADGPDRGVCGVVVGSGHLVYARVGELSSLARRQRGPSSSRSSRPRSRRGR